TLAESACERPRGSSGKAHEARVDRVASHDEELNRLGVGDLRLAEDVENVVCANGLEIPLAGVHADQDVALADARKVGCASGHDRLNVEPTSKAVGRRGDVVGGN